MKLFTSAIRNSLFILALFLALTGLPAAAQTTAQSSSATQAQTIAVPARITQAIDETQLITLKGNVHPLARKEFDQGVVSDALPMKRMLLVLKRNMEQESALTQLMVDQYNTNSPSYHKWLTPEEFGSQFGPADSDIQAVTTWLQGHGFRVAKVSKGKIAIEFSGTAGQVREAFHTEIHTFLVNGESHMANASDPQIPAALAPVVHGLAPLNNFRPKPHHHVAGEFTKSTVTAKAKSVKPDFSTSGGDFALGPTDFATIYNVAPLWTAGTDGTGQSIAVIGVSNINLQDVSDFRTLFGLPTGGAANTPIVVIDGGSANDPGIVTGGSETEALLDVEWSGGVAKGAQIHFVIASDTDIASGLLLAIFNVIDNNSDPILSLSFGDCEPNEGANNLGLWEPLWEQAAAQGITVTVSTGDSGAAGCEDDMATAPNPAGSGLQVSGFASTPFNVAVGGTDFNDVGTQSTYFSSANDPTTLASALSYIPENAWNETCTNVIFNGVTGLTTPEANCNSTNAEAAASVVTLGGSGGASHCFTLSGTTCSGGYAKPAYQQFAGLTGMPADGTRDLPDVSLFASTGDFPSTALAGSKSFYVVCEADAVNGTSCNKTGSFSFLAVGGTSASTPSFAGIMALVNQKYGRQGNANFVLYKLAQMQDTAGTACSSVASPLPNANCTFNDIPSGSTIATPCVKNSLNCNPTTGTDSIGVLSGYSTTAGYDLATGLGSVNADNLVNNWSKGVTGFTASNVSLTLSPTTGIFAGQSVTVNITVTPSTATGDVALTSNAATGEGVDGFALGSGGKVVNGATTQLTGGTYQVTARYGGDGTFAPSVSAPVTVTVNKAATDTAGSVLVALGGGNFANFTSGAAPVTLFLQASVSPTVVANNSPLTPTGTVTFTDSLNGGAPTTVASNVGINQASEAFTASGISTFAPGNHSIVATYSGDSSFTASTALAVTFTLTGTTNNPVPVITPPLVPASAVAGAGSFTLTINGTGFISSSKVTFGTSAGLVPSSVTATQIMVTIPATAIASTGTPGVTVTNPAPGGGPSNSVAFTVNANTGTFTAKGPANTVAITAGSSANVVITLTPSGGFTSAGVTINCPTLPPGVHCPMTALSIPVPNANLATGQLAVSVDAPAAMNATASVIPAEGKPYVAGLILGSGGKGWWTLSGISGLLAVLLLLLPGRKRYRAALGFGLLCILSFTLGCGGSYGGGGGGGGPVVTTTHIMVTSVTKGGTGTAFTFTATVSGGTPTDMVQLFDGATAIGSAVAVSGGTANLTTGPISTVGTHAISAHYLGDATSTQPSSSGALNVTVTGPTTFSIAATPAASNGSPAINITIN